MNDDRVTQTTYRIADNRLSANGASAESPAVDGPRRVGYVIGMLRTGLGPRIRTPRQALTGGAARGALAGHTTATQSRTLDDETAQAEAGARQRTASFARAAYTSIEQPLIDFRVAVAAIARARNQLPSVEKHLDEARLAARTLAAAEAGLALSQPIPDIPPAPSKAEFEARARDEIPGYRVWRPAKASLFAGAAVIEGLFVGALVADVGAIGLPGLPVTINVTLPWFVGGVLGGLIPFTAERVAHAESRAPTPVPWYQRYATAAVIATPAVLGLARAVYMLVETGVVAGFLGLGITLLMTALALVGAVVGHREREGQVWDEERYARQRVREQIRISRMPPPSAEALALAAIREQRERADADVAAFDRRHRDLLDVWAQADDESEQAKAELLIAAARSKAQVDQEAALADGVRATFAQRRAATMARYLKAPPWQNGSGKIEPTKTADLPRLEVDALIEQAYADHPDASEEPGGSEEENDA